MAEKYLLLGDEALALGALHAGLSGVFAYPGTPSTEITEYIQAHPLTKERGLHCEWSSNEKTAMESALGMSYSGKRTLVCMKHVGMNVCADAFVNSAITGANGGLVVVACDDPVSINDFVPSAPKSGEEMMNILESYIDKIHKTDIKDIVNYVVSELYDKLLYYPAAQSNHHSVRCGLLYHTTTMLASAEAMCKIYTELDPDWLYAGVILHDIEKTEEMNASELGLVSDYTRKGLLLGHVIQGPLIIGEAGRAVNAREETIVLLQHMLISHHYEPEFGAVKRPMFPEAEMLHYLDMIDARMYDFRKALAEVNEGGFSDKQWLLNNRRLYKKESEESDE